MSHILSSIDMTLRAIDGDDEGARTSCKAAVEGPQVVDRMLGKASCESLMASRYNAMLERV